MAFLSTGNPLSLIRDLWPLDSKLPRDPQSYDACLDWQVVPSTAQQLTDWLCVIPKHRIVDKSRPFDVVHGQSNANGVKYQVSLRMQGFLLNSNIGPVGDWDGSARNAHQAVQSVVLHGGGHNDTWTATIRQLNRLIAVVTRMACRDQDPDFLAEDGDTTLKLQRRVFVKASRSPPGNDDGYLAPEYSPHVRALRSVATQWLPDFPLAVGQKTDTGVRRCNPILVQRGDFVDVLASIEVVRKRNHVRVYFLLDRLVQLSTADLVPAPTPMGQNTVIKETGDEVFDDDDEDF